MKTGLLGLTISDAHNHLKKGDFTARELVEAYIQAMENDKLNAFVTKTQEKALQQADRVDALLQKGENVDPIAGMPIGVKDLFCTNGTRTTACSNILKEFIPPYESTVTQRLWDNGAVMLGKLNMDEFAMGSANSYSCFGQAINPWKGEGGEDLIPGGSSGGSSAAVAGMLCIGATGSDTGGSVRQPAALCGIVGVKPTYGRCSRWGMIAFSSSLDQAGVLTRTVEDAAIMLQSMCGHDKKDATSSPAEVPNFLAGIRYDLKGIKIGVPVEYGIPNNDEKGDFTAMWDENLKYLQDCGAEIIEISLPHTKYALPVYYVVASAEASSNLARYDGVRYGARVEGSSLNEMYELTRSVNLGEEVKRRILLGGFALSLGCYKEYYDKAQRVRNLVQHDFIKAFEQVDYILTLTTPRISIGVSEELETIDRYYSDVFTVPASLAGLPALSVPSGISKKKLPMALQVIGKHYDECGILNVGAVIHKRAGNLLKYLHDF